MVHDVTGWVFSKKTSMHTSSDERKYKALEKTAHPSTAVEKQPKCTGYQSSKISRVKYGSNLIEYLTDDPGKMEEQCNSSNNPKKYYAPLPQHKNSKNLLKVNKYPSKTIDIAPKTPDFASLKHEITLYENRAREIYGLTFERVPPKESVEDF
jgi:RNA processing factor Prp31